MRAKEFIIETKEGKPLDAQAKVSPGMVYTPDRYYDLYRSMLMVARAPSDTSDLDPYSWISNTPAIVTYTDEERELVKKAFQKLGVPFKEHMPEGSEEPKAVNKESPVKEFKGY